MIRDLLCTTCAEKRKPHPEDIANGIVSRMVPLVVKKPKNLSIETHTTSPFESTVVVEPIKVMMCDRCSAEIHDGDNAVAVTVWDTNRESEPGNWEAEYQL